MMDDLPLDGVPAIAKFLNKDPRHVYTMLRAGALPVAFKMGRRWCLRRSSYFRYLSELEAASQAAASQARGK